MSFIFYVQFKPTNSIGTPVTLLQLCVYGGCDFNLKVSVVASVEQFLVSLVNRDHVLNHEKLHPSTNDTLKYSIIT